MTKSNKFEIEESSHQGIFLIKYKDFLDSRGLLTKFYQSDLFSSFNFSVDDIYTTTSHKNVVRGLHHQVEGFGQAKLVSCLSGCFWDIALDIRIDSPHYGTFFCFKLSPSERTSVLIPAGFSHGTYSLEDNTTMLSICSGAYIPEKESGFRMASLNLPFYTENSITSQKDDALIDFIN